MPLERCTECPGVPEEVSVDTTDLGPHAARGLLPPLRILCGACMKRLGLEPRTEGGLPFVLVQGQEFRLLGGAFVRSEHPQAVKMYYRDEK